MCTVFGYMSGICKCLPLYHHKGNLLETDEGDTIHQTSVEPMIADNRKATLQEIHTDAVNKVVNDRKQI